MPAPGAGRARQGGEIVGHLGTGLEPLHEEESPPHAPPHPVPPVSVSTGEASERERKPKPAKKQRTPHQPGRWLDERLGAHQPAPASTSPTPWCCPSPCSSPGWPSCFFGGELPAHEINSRLYVMHILLVPALFARLLGAHLAILWRQKHTQFPGKSGRERNVVGSYLWPKLRGQEHRVVLLRGRRAGRPGRVGPDQLRVAVRAVPPRGRHHRRPAGLVRGLAGGRPAPHPGLGTPDLRDRPPNAFFPGALLPGITFELLYAWPFLEARFTGDPQEHHSCSGRRTEVSHSPTRSPRPPCRGRQRTGRAGVPAIGRVLGRGSVRLASTGVQAPPSGRRIHAASSRTAASA